MNKPYRIVRIANQTKQWVRYGDGEIARIKYEVDASRNAMVLNAGAEIGVWYVVAKISEPSPAQQEAA